MYIYFANANAHINIKQTIIQDFVVSAKKKRIFHMGIAGFCERGTERRNMIQYTENSIFRILKLCARWRTLFKGWKMEKRDMHFIPFLFSHIFILFRWTSLMSKILMETSLQEASTRITEISFFVKVYYRPPSTLNSEMLFVCFIVI